jgi:multisubunit Na+/H+ antiporter MnhF subunit
MELKKIISYFFQQLFFEKECDFKDEINCSHLKNSKCSIFNSYSELPPDKKTEVTIEFFKLKWGKWTVRTVIFGLGIIFLVSIIKVIFNPNIESEKVALFDALQIWVSFILGIIASLFSIISMYLSFYNLEQQQQAEKRTKDSFDELKEKIINSINEEIKKEIKNVHDSLEKHLKQIEDKFPQEYAPAKRVDTNNMEYEYEEDIYGDEK